MGHMKRHCWLSKKKRIQQSENSRSMKPNSIAEQELNPNNRLFSIDVSKSSIIISDSAWSSNSVNKIVVNSGASNHVVCNSNVLTNVRQVPKVQVELPNSFRIKSSQQQILFLYVDPERITLTNAYYIPGLSLNITFCSRLNEREVRTTVKNGTCHFTDPRDGVIVASITKRLSDGLLVTPLLLQSRHIDTDNKSMKDTHRSQKIEAASSGKTFDYSIIEWTTVILS